MYWTIEQMDSAKEKKILSLSKCCHLQSIPHVTLHMDSNASSMPDIYLKNMFSTIISILSSDCSECHQVIQS
jgi:hypothetical protein